MNTVNSELVEPSVNLLESMRSVGYSLEAAIADLIDNSITAGASHVAIDVDVIDGKYVAILDDGCGMTSGAAREALRLAGAVTGRADTDLGRFGLGLKTASLAQARCLTVITKQAGTTTALRWDIDFVRTTGEWRLIVLDEADLHDAPLWSEFSGQPSGTLVLWNNLDLLLSDATEPGAFLSKRLDGVRASLALVFHRFLADKRKPFSITTNGLVLSPIDPFLSNNPKTQRSEPEFIQIGDTQVRVEAFTLPHSSGLTPEERRRPDLGDGMREAQGFYVYRNRRLVSHGHWYGLSRMNELSKQTRIQVDVPTSLDALWQLDIRKSQAEPPQSFKLRLQQLMERILSPGRRVQTFRGRSRSTKVTPIWTPLSTRDGFTYEVNLESPLVKSVLSRLSTDDAERVEDLLQTIASTFPIQDAYIQLARNDQPIKIQPDRDALIARLSDIFRSGVLSEDPVEATTQLAGVEPFDSVEELSTLVDIVWRDTDGAE